MKIAGNPAAYRRYPNVADYRLLPPLTRWLRAWRERLLPTVYVDGCDVPDLPESPYRARLTIPLEQGGTGISVRERDVVRGQMKTIYQVRCPCGKRWFNPRHENVQPCPRCGRAVLLI